MGEIENALKGCKVVVIPAGEDLSFLFNDLESSTLFVALSFPFTSVLLFNLTRNLIHFLMFDFCRRSKKAWNDP